MKQILLFERLQRRSGCRRLYSRMRFAEGRFGRYRSGAPSLPGDHAQYPPESLLRVRLQRPRRADRCWRSVSLLRRASEPDDRCSGDELQLSLSDRERAAPAAVADLMIKAD